MANKVQGIIDPPIDELLTKVDSKFALVVFAAKRARTNLTITTLTFTREAFSTTLGRSSSRPSTINHFPSRCAKSTRTSSRSGRSPNSRGGRGRSPARPAYAHNYCRCHGWNCRVQGRVACATACTRWSRRSRHPNNSGPQIHWKAHSRSGVAQCRRDRRFRERVARATRRERTIGRPHRYRAGHREHDRKACSRPCRRSPHDDGSSEPCPRYRRPGNAF